jgi:hypothetical protein
MVDGRHRPAGNPEISIPIRPRRRGEKDTVGASNIDRNKPDHAEPAFGEPRCQPTDPGCGPMPLNAVTETGTYTTTGSQFELVGPATSRTRSYCVENGSLLHIVEVGVTSTDPAAMTIIITDGVAARR